MISTSELHPMLVHFPIALVIVGFIAELASVYFKKELSLSKMGFYLLIFGTLSAIAAGMAGALFTGEMSGAAGAIRDSHAMYAKITIVALIIASVLRIVILVKKNENTRLKWVAFIFYGVAAISVSITGFFGGTLVYNYMMSI